VQALFAVAGVIGKITRAEEETKLTPDAMPENAAGKEEARGTIGGRGTRGGSGSSRRVIERCARHYRSPLQKILDPGTRSRALEYVPRRAPEAPEDNEMSRRREFREVKPMKERT